LNTSRENVTWGDIGVGKTNLRELPKEKVKWQASVTGNFLLK